MGHGSVVKYLVQKAQELTSATQRSLILHACRKDFTPSLCLDSIVSTFSLIPGMRYQSINLNSMDRRPTNIPLPSISRPRTEAATKAIGRRSPRWCDMHCHA